MISSESEYTVTKLNRKGLCWVLESALRSSPKLCLGFLSLFSFAFRVGHEHQLSSNELMCRKGWKLFTCLEMVSHRDKGGAVLRIDVMFLRGFPNAKFNSERMRFHFSNHKGENGVGGVQSIQYSCPFTATTRLGLTFSFVQGCSTLDTGL